MSRHRFQTIDQYLDWGNNDYFDDTIIPDEKFWWRRADYLINSINNAKKRCVIPGKCIVVDENMMKWKGRKQSTTDLEGCPAIRFVRRKPEPLGLELKNVCDNSSGKCNVVPFSD